MGGGRRRQKVPPKSSRAANLTGRVRSAVELRAAAHSRMQVPLSVLCTIIRSIEKLIRAGLFLFIPRRMHAQIA